jgi:TonB-dependent Receptor Plug Domain
VAPVSEAVAVTAPAPSAGTPGVTTLTALDVVRTPGTQADLMRALQLTPGVAQVDEGAGLYVRGGDVSEVLVLLDGAVVNHPYRYETPTGGFRGAVDPFMTQGASFTTGAFSAAYGNALSAVLDLQSLGRARARQATFTAGLAGISASLAQPLGARAGFRLAANRTTPSVLFSVNRSPKSFDRLPGGWDTSAGIAIDSARVGSLSAIALVQRDHVGVELEQDAYVGFLHSGTRHELGIMRWQRAVGAGWLATLSAGIDDYTNSTDVGVLALDEGEQHRSVRGQVSGGLGRWTIVSGIDSDFVRTDVTGVVPARGGDFGGVSGSLDFRIRHDDWRMGVFGIGTRTVGRVSMELGSRIDRFGGADVIAADPRAAVRVTIGSRGSLRVAAGRYHQFPSPTYLDSVRGADSLLPMASTHLVAGFEHGSPGDPLFARVEIYRKWYDDLPLQDPEAGFSSGGTGRSRGVDAFVRRAWSRLDLRVSGSLLDASRRWTPPTQRDRYPLPSGEWTPDFEIPYSLSVIGSVPLGRGVSGAATWRRAAGRLYTPAIGAVETRSGFEPVWGPINSARLPRYERVDLSISLLRPLGGKAMAVFFASVANTLGRENAFEVAYSSDYSVRRFVTTATPRSFYIGCSITR